MCLSKSSDTVESLSYLLSDNLSENEERRMEEALSAIEEWEYDFAIKKLKRIDHPEIGKYIEELILLKKKNNRGWKEIDPAFLDSMGNISKKVFSIIKGLF